MPLLALISGNSTWNMYKANWKKLPQLSKNPKKPVTENISFNRRFLVTGFFPSVTFQIRVFLIESCSWLFINRWGLFVVTPCFFL
jgi:hypothetical protein